MLGVFFIVWTGMLCPVSRRNGNRFRLLSRKWFLDPEMGCYSAGHLLCYYSRYVEPKYPQPRCLFTAEKNPAFESSSRVWCREMLALRGLVWVEWVLSESIFPHSSCKDGH
jgi:hypothetical protein